MTERDRIMREYLEAMSFGDGVVEVGRTVLCDSCGGDLTDDPRSGGILFCSYAYGPCCLERMLDSIHSYGEERYIKAVCPQGVSYADWVRDTLRGGDPCTITVTSK